MRIIAALLFLVSFGAFAQEQRCDDLGDNCLASVQFTQSTSYTGTGGTSNAWYTGNNVGSKPGYPFNGTNAASIWCNFHCDESDPSTGIVVSTDASVLAKLPNRDQSKVVRFLRQNDDSLTTGSTGQASTYDMGYYNFPASAKRVAMRWYDYRSNLADDGYEWDFTWDNECTNGKIAHIGNSNGGDGPFITLTMGNGALNGTSMYSFQPANGWEWDGVPSFNCCAGGANNPRPVQGVFNTSDLAGNWFRHEIVIMRPNVADSDTAGLGFDYSYFVKNVTADTDEVEDLNLSAGCPTCAWIPSGTPNQQFTWDTGIHPTSSINDIHTRHYREHAQAGNDICVGWMGWLHFMVAYWDTDDGQRIGAAEEVEGGSSTPDPVVILFDAAPFLLGLLIMFLAALGIRYHVRGRKVEPQLLGYRRSN